jgi:hypothetical protein
MVCLSVAGLVAMSFGADAGLPPDIKTKIDAKIALYKAWETAPEIVKAVKDHNANPPAEYKDMTNDKWKAVTVMSPEARALTKNDVAAYMKAHKDSSIVKAFVSGSDGTKVGFLAKTLAWNHAGAPKHDIPMTGKIWIGHVEVDKGTGIEAVQVGFPVLDNGKAIGSIVIDFATSKL